MRIKSSFQFLGFLMLVMFLCLTSLSFAQRGHRLQRTENGLLQARLDAQRDAQTDVNQFLWGAGSCVLASVGSCLLGSVGVIGANAYQPTPPPDRLLGKSPQYVTSYTKAYQTKSKRLQMRASAIGCIGGTIVNGILWRMYYF